MAHDVTTTQYQLDRVDLALLTLLADDPLWKSKVHTNLLALEHVENVSVQTVGRRMDRLHQDGYLSTVIVTPENLHRDLIIAFKTTEKGRNAIAAQRRELLKDAVKHELFGEPANAETVEDEFLLQAVREELGLHSQETTSLAANRAPILSLVALYYALKRVEAIFDSETIDAFVATVQNNETLDAVFVEPQIRELVS